jgi:steroid 5-alpha reductase family enzyme
MQTYLTTLAAVFAAMFVLWLLSLAKRDASVVDPFWGIGFVLVVWVAFATNRHEPPRSLLLAVLTTIWGARLSLFLLWRNWGHGEDRRYQAMRAQHGERFWWVSLMTVYLLQGIILWFVSLPIQVVSVNALASSLSWLDVVGVAVWGTGVFFETIGDWQLARFKADPNNAGKVMDRGLWRYTRHPNYFGDFCVWWGLFQIAAAGGAWWTVLSPLLMSVLLLKVSGVTLLEKTITERRPDYAAYQARTNAFFPGRPKQSPIGKS